MTVNELGYAIHRIKAYAGLRPNDSISIELHGLEEDEVGDTFTDTPAFDGSGSAGNGPLVDDYIGNILDFRH